jgi:hypothetical protein
MFLSLFQTASGSWHVQSILIALGWLITGGLLLIQLAANRDERMKSFEKEQLYQEELKDAREQIAGFEIRPLSYRLRELLNEIDPQILPALENGDSHIKIRINQSQYVRLHNLSAEKEAASYITLDPLEDKVGNVSDKESYVEYRMSVRLKPALLEAPLHGFNLLKDKQK